MLLDHRHNANFVGGGQNVGGNRSQAFLAVSLSRSSIGAFVVNAGATVDLNWGLAAYDFGGWFSPSTSTIVTVPNGVTRVRVLSQVLFIGAFGAADIVKIAPTKNGSPILEGGRVSYLPKASVFNTWTMINPPFDVVPGDTLGVEVNAVSITPASLTVFGSATTAFAVEAVTMEF